jgi:hypothetical protein
MKKGNFLCICLVLISSIVFADNVLFVYPDLGPTKSEKLTSMMKQISMRLKNDYSMEISLSQPVPFPAIDQKEKIFSLASEGNFNQIVYINIDVLDSKVFYNVLKLNLADQATLFQDNFTIMQVEDFEVIINRFALMLGANKPWNETISIDNVTVRDGQKRRQQNSGHFGIILGSGVAHPFGESLTRTKSSYYYDSDLVQPTQFLILSGGVTYDIRKLCMDAQITLLGYSGMSFGIGANYYFKDDFFAPYAGGALSAGWVWNTVAPENPDTSSYYSSRKEYTDDVGIGITGRLGTKFLRGSFFQPFIELDITSIIATRIEYFAGLRFGIVTTF